MSEVKNVQLAFGNFESSGPFAGQIDNVKVDFIAKFTAEEAGKKNRVRIDLFEKRSNAETNPPNTRIPVPFFTFTYGFIKADYYTLVAVEGEMTQSVAYRVNKSLNTNPGIFFDGFRFYDTPEFFYAVVTLSPDVTSTSARSEIVNHTEF
jgi:hypothetical protein